MKNFILYAESKEWEHIITTNELTKAQSKAKNLNPDKYYSYMIIEHDTDKDCDKPIELGEVYKKENKMKC